MPRPYSADLRERVVKKYLEGVETYESVSRLFQVGQASVTRWVAHYRQTGSFEHRPMGGDRKSKFDENSDAVLSFLVHENPDATLDELVDWLAQECELFTSSSAVDRALKRLKITRKKRRSKPKKRTPHESKS